jgi:diguanylate cyclase (GGDEF)-like protein
MNKFENQIKPEQLAKNSVFMRRLLEKSLALRAQAYQSQVKADLLMQAIMQIEYSKRNLQSLNETLALEIANRKRVEEKIRFMADHDALTQLPNRTLFSDRLERAIQLAERKKESLALLFIDLDGFKDVNDTLGHKAGDLLLQAVARRLNNTVRNSDTVARIGGDEFIVLLNAVSNAESAGLVAEKILLEMATPFTLAENTAQIGASIGISLYPEHSVLPDKLIAFADAAMYNIKKTSKNAFAFHLCLAEGL